MLTLPDEIAGEQARRTSSQGTKAWGDPSIAVLRGGVTPPGPTTDRCVSASGVDWISRPADDDDSTWAFTSYGRTPAVEVLVDRRADSGNDVLAAISPALAKIAPEAECVGAEAAEGGSVPTGPVSVRASVIDQGDRDELTDELGALEPGLGPHERIRGGGGEPGQSVEFVDEHLAGVGDEGVDTGQTGAVEEAEHRGGQFLNARRRGLVERGRAGHLGVGEVEVLRVEVIE